MRFSLILSLLFAFISNASAKETVVTNGLGKFDVGALAPWMIRYTDERKPRLRMNTLMKELKINRLQAAEVQNHFLDGFDDKLSDAQVKQLFDQSVVKAKAGEYESQIDLAKIYAAPFVVVFDLDATLYDQTLAAGSSCADFEYAGPSGAKKAIKLTPGWENIFDRVLKLGGKIVLFSANKDDETLNNLSHWMWRGRPLINSASGKIHSDLSGVLTNHHLIRQAADEGDGEGDRQKGTVVSEASKDLRILDETLRKVIIVDDNPLRLFQLQNARVVEKFEGRRYCELKNKSDSLSKLISAKMENLLPQVATEIEKASRRKTYDFAQSFLPYSYFGALTLRSLSETKGAPDANQLEELLVQNPSIVRTRY